MLKPHFRLINILKNSLMQIKDIRARSILNSKGEWAVEVRLFLKKRVFTASCPSGTSKGEREAVERADAVEKINQEIASQLAGKKIESQEQLDRFLIHLDGTDNKSRLGANALLPISIAGARAMADIEGIELWRYISRLIGVEPGFPSPCLLFVEGGVHAGGGLDTQEFMAVPRGKTFKQEMERGVEIYKQLRDRLRQEYGESAVNVGMEGGMAPPVEKTEKMIEIIGEVVNSEERLVLDVAASTFYKNGSYNFEGRNLSRKALADFYKSLPVWALEDPFSEDDEKGWEIGSGLFKIGDDLTVTNPEIIRESAEKGLIQGVVIKPNQIGTVTEALEAVKAAREKELTIFVKHRSGETNDDFIADLALGVGAEYIMAGAPNRGERTAKYNRLLNIENDWR